MLHGLEDYFVAIWQYILYIQPTRYKQYPGELSY